MQQQNIQAQSQANQQAQQAAAQAEMQKNQQKMQIDAQMEQTRNQMKIAYLKQEVAAKKELMQFEFNLNSQLEGMRQDTDKEKEDKREDRKDQRVDRQAGHQMNMIDQRNKQTNKGDSTKKFESSGNDTLTGGAGIQKFSPF